MSTQQQDARPRATIPPAFVRRHALSDFPEPHCWNRLTKAEAEDVLGWLEAHGLQGELSRHETGFFVVRCRC
jgi:hypothetical protein